jgi:hypothetical protein
MIFALNFPVMEKWLKTVEKKDFWTQVQIKGTVATILFALTSTWLYYVGFENKFIYNARAPYSFFIPMLTFIFFRNMVPKWRGRHCALLLFAGKVRLRDMPLDTSVASIWPFDLIFSISNSVSNDISYDIS